MKSTRTAVRVLALIVSLTFLMAMLPIVSTVMAAPQIDGWNFGFSGGVNAEIDVDDGALNIKLNSGIFPNRFLYITTPVPVEAGKTYVWGLRARARNASGIVAGIDWNHRTTLTPYSGTYDWTNFEFLFPSPSSGSVNIMLTLENFTDDFWISNVWFYEYVNGARVGDNLVITPNFRGIRGSSPVVASDGNNQVQVSGNPAFRDNEEKFLNVMTSDTYSAKDYMDVLGATKFVPVFPAKGITIDGDLSDWEGYTGSLTPTTGMQYQIYHPQPSYDVTGEFKYAYDDENFYLAIKVYDPVFVSQNNSNYWASDSIQIAMGTIDEHFGSEIGFVLGQDGTPGVYGNVSSDVIDRITLAAKREGNYTFYEASIPWTAIFEEREHQWILHVLKCQQIRS